ncbi:MAG: SBBP repeat-containing protein [candidate division WOR-3 bacterium]
MLLVILTVPAYADPIWLKRYNGPGDGFDCAWSIATDAQGCVYVTGQSNGDYATVKYDAGGAQIWVARYDGPGHGEDVAQSIAVDSAGNVYVTGYSMGEPATGRDYATIKYDANGNELWVARYNCGAGNRWDEGYDIAVDGAGCVYVTGSSDSTTNRDFATVKYSPDGIQQWAARYTSPGNIVDNGYHIALDRQGNVYVLGSVGTGAAKDIALVKYNQSGQQQWAVIYNGLGNGSDGPSGLVVDAQGNAYVCGSTTRATLDCVTIKYRPTGDTLWTRFYDGTAHGIDWAMDIDLDGQGNVYVAGRAHGATSLSDFVTIKYNSAGVEQWIATYDGPENGEDEARAVGVDAAGNVYTTGWSPQTDSTGNSYVTVKYNSSGTQQWAAVYTGRQWWNEDRSFALAVDSRGNVIVTGRSDNDCGTVKYEPGGARLWEAWYWGPGRDEDQAWAMAMDPGRNVYVAGLSIGPGTGEDYAVVKYHWSGVQLWEARFDGPAHGNDAAYDVATDANRNIYVTGKVRGPDGDDFGTVKFDSLGHECWSVINDRGGSDEAYYIAVDGSGSVYVAGKTDNGGPEYDNYCVICYDSAGEEQWAVEYNGPESDEDHLSGLVLDDSGNAYVTGWSYNTHWPEFATIKYGPAGDTLWVARYSGPLQDWSKPYAIARDSTGFIYVAGTTWNGTNLDFALVKYATSGETVWTRTCDSPLHDDDEAFAIAVSTAGNVYIVGYCRDFADHTDYFTVAFNAAGQQLWTANYDGGEGDDCGRSVAVDANSNVWVTGESRNSAGDDDIVTVMYNSDGVQQSVERYGGSSGDNDLAAKVIINAHGDVYVCGSAKDTFTDWDFITIRYPSAVGIVHAEGQRSQSPLTYATIVRGVLFLPEVSGGEQGVSRILLDVSGRKVMELRPGPNEMRHLSPGVYFVRSVGCERLAVGCQKVVIAR